MAFIDSPNMFLPIPSVGNEPGPLYADDINDSLTLIDSHDHTLGKGVQITPDGLNINSDLTFNSNGALFLKFTRFTPQISPLAGVQDLGELYVAGVDLYYNDVSGNQVRITQNGSVTGSTGTITGLPSGTASASYDAGSGTFIFQSATNVAANIDAGSYILRNNTVNSKGLTLSPPNAMAANYGITLPLLPSVKGIVAINSSGTMTVEPSPTASPSVVTMDIMGNLGTQIQPYDITVGLGGQYSTITAAIAAASTDQTILIGAGTFTEDVTINKRLNIQGKGFGTIINGNLIFDTGSNDSAIELIQVTGNVTFNSGVQEVTLSPVWVASTTVFSGDRGNFVQGMRL